MLTTSQKLLCIPCQGMVRQSTCCFCQNHGGNDSQSSGSCLAPVILMMQLQKESSTKYLLLLASNGLQVSLDAILMVD